MIPTYGLNLGRLYILSMDEPDDEVVIGDSGFERSSNEYGLPSPVLILVSLPLFPNPPLDLLFSSAFLVVKQQPSRHQQHLK